MHKASREPRATWNDCGITTEAPLVLPPLPEGPFFAFLLVKDALRWALSESNSANAWSLLVVYYNSDQLHFFSRKVE